MIHVTHRRTGIQYTIVSTSSQHLLLNLLPFHTYIFKIAAVTIGVGPYTSELVVTLLEDGKKEESVRALDLSFIHYSAPDAAPESVSGYAINATSIFLGWEPPPNDTHNGIIRGYQINCTEVDTDTEFNVSSPQTELIITDLHPDYTYSCRVSAVTIETGVFSGNITVQTDEAGLCIIDSKFDRKHNYKLSLSFCLFSSKWTSTESVF